MYNSKIICTYHTDEIFLPTDDINELEKGFIRNVIYRQELLNILEMDNYSEEEMTLKLKELYELLKECEEMKECMMEMANIFHSQDIELGLMMLFSYDYLFITHKCINEYLENKIIPTELLDKIKQNLFNKD